MSSFRLRHARPEDAPAVLGIVRALDERFIGHSSFTAEELADEWRKIDLDRDAFVVADGDTLIGYGSCDMKGDPRVDGYVHPDHFGRGIGGLVVDTLENELAARGADAVRSATLLADEPGQALLRGRGYTEVRRFSHMSIELTEEPAPPGAPIETLDASEGEAFHAAYEDAFADHWGHIRRSFDEWRLDHMEGALYAPELWRVVRDDDGRIVAGLIGNWEREGEAHVSRLFTIPSHRGRGLGKALLLDAFGLFWRGGKRAVGLGVDAASNTGANRLYERAGMHVRWGAVVFEKRLDA